VTENAFEENTLKARLAAYLGFGFGLPSEGAAGVGEGDGDGGTVDATDGGIEDGGHDADNGSFSSLVWAGISDDAIQAEMERRNAELKRRQAAELERFRANLAALSHRPAAGSL
jgi:hypothetical protein